VRRLLNDLAQITTGDGFAQYITNELADGGKGGVIDRFHVGYQGGETFLEQPLFDHMLREKMVVDLAATLASDRIGVVLFLGDHESFQFYLLDDTRGRSRKITSGLLHSGQAVRR